MDFVSIVTIPPEAKFLIFTQFLFPMDFVSIVTFYPLKVTTKVNGFLFPMDFVSIVTLPRTPRQWTLIDVSISYGFC